MHHPAVIRTPSRLKYPLSIWGLCFRSSQFPICFLHPELVIFQIVFLLHKPVSALYSNGLLSPEFPPLDDLAEKFLVLCDCLSRLCTLCISNVVAQFEHLLKTLKNHSVKILQTRNSCSGERASWLFTIFSEVWWEAQCSRLPGGEWQKLTYTSPLVGT